MANSCNPDGLFYITNECILGCYYQLHTKELKEIDRGQCFSHIEKRNVISANYSRTSFQRTTAFAWAMGSLNVFVLLLFLCWFNIPNYKRILDRSSKLDQPRWKRRLDQWWRIAKYVFTFMPQVIDSVLDAIYFSKLSDDSNPYVHVPREVLNTLAAFLAFAVLKDVICNIWTNTLMKYEIIQSTPKLAEMTRIKADLSVTEVDAKVHLKSNVKLITVYRKSVILFYSLILEDGVQLFLQYFYFEKFMTEKDNFIIVNATVKFVMMFRFVFFIAKFFIKADQNLPLRRVKWFIMTSLVSVFILTLPVARLVAYIIQTLNEGKVNGHCLEYISDDDGAYLLASPFAFACIQVRFVFFYHSDELQGNWLDTSDYVRPVNDGQFGVCGAQNTSLNQCSLSKVQISDNARDKWSKYIQPVWSRIPRFGYCDKSKAWWSEPNEEYIQSESCTTAQNSDQAMTKNTCNSQGKKQ